jgi:hypothetical protein
VCGHPAQPGEAQQLVAETFIKEIRNNSNAQALLTNLRTGQSFSLAPGGATSVTMTVPWCGDGTNWPTSHIQVTVASTYFAVWQASHNFIDRVRLSADGSWSKPGAEIGGFAAVGLLETLLGGSDRTLVINDKCSEHW